MGNKKKLNEMQQMERERQHKALEAYLRTGHAKPRSRREFLASGLMAFGGYIVAPSILQLMMSSKAQAAVTCDVTSAAGLVPFINVNLSGGAALHSSTVPLTIAGNMLTSYNIIGLGDPANFTVNMDFGNVPFASAGGVSLSPFNDGLTATAGTAKAKTSWVNVFVRSQDDTSNNEFSIAGLVEQAGIKGALLPNLGTSATRTGVGQQPAYSNPSQALKVNSFNDFLGAMSVDNSFNGLSTGQKNSLLDLIRNLSATQKARLSGAPTGKTLGDLVECATGKNFDNSSNIANAGIDPRLDPNVAAVWGISPGATTGPLTQASITYAALAGKAGVAGIDIGGYDYHGQARTGTDTSDKNAGMLVGRILKTAEVMGKPVFIHVTSDGSVSGTASATPGSTGWTGDYGTGGMSYIIAFDPSGRRATTSGQIGGFTNGQGVDDSVLSGWSPKLSAMAVFANYAKFSNRMDLFSAVQNNTLDATQQSKILRF